MSAVLDFPQPGADPLAVLYARFLSPLQRFFAGYRLSAADIDDLTQDVFVRLIGCGASGSLRKPDAFVFTLARNLVRDRARRLHTRAAAATVRFEEIELPCESLTPEQEIVQRERLHHVTVVLAGLKPATCQAFVLHRVHGYNYAQIAHDMGISVSMVEKHIMAAGAALRQIDTQDI